MASWRSPSHVPSELHPWAILRGSLPIASKRHGVSRTMLGRRRRPQEVVAPRAGTLEEDLPTTFKIWHPRDCLLQLFLLGNAFLAQPLNEFCAANWSSKNLDAFMIPHRRPQFCHPRRHTPTLFHVRVLPVCNCIPAIVDNLTLNKSLMVQMRSGFPITHTSSKNANKNSPSINCSFTSANALWMARLKSNGMRGSPCSPPSCCPILWLTPSSSDHQYVGNRAYVFLTNGNMERRLGTSCNFDRVELR